mmetsp:Transcript_26651/g.64740  ORF Transcript_26651/g.64740 Transcript_26651/m.64740 type:complete len:501 (-) Transcript_26651:109-1611(-)
MFRLVVEPALDASDPALTLETVRFTSGIPHATDAYTGHIRLFRTADRPTDTFPSDTLCLLAVPAYMTAADLCNFVAPHAHQICTMRILKDARAENRYMVVMKFHAVAHAEEFARGYDGKRFSTISEERCRVLPVADIVADDGGAGDPAQMEMPTCPVCLERLDSATSGIMTSLCNHSMHSSCLSKWGDNSCPVCRFCQEPEPESNACMSCGTSESLWMCLICGHVGCGRYVEFHALAHFKDTNHTFSMEMETGRVWDYAGDNYVHRLIVNKTDGKLVELPPHRTASTARAAGDGSATASKQPSEKFLNAGDEDGELLAAQYASKVDAVTKEFDHLLTSQLESQRVYYEERLEKAENGGARELSTLQSKLNDVLMENERLRAAEQEAVKARRNAVRKSQEAAESLAKTKTEFDFLQSLNDTLIKNQADYKKRVESIENINRQLATDLKTREEELRDLALHLETLSSTMAAPGGNELAGADLIGIAESPQAARRSRLRGKAR